MLDTAATARKMLSMIYDKNKFLVIAGPCALEDSETPFVVAKIIAALQKKYDDVTFVYKSSYDKANRMSIDSPRGVGVEEGLKFFQKIRDTYHLPVLTDVHSVEQAKIAATVCDVLQIPAFLCRQTDILVAAGQTGRAVNIKKGQFLAPQDMSFAVEKVRAAGAQEVWQTERGTSFGYHNLIVDMRSIPIMTANLAPVIFDATHSVQLPGGGGKESSGERAYVPVLAKAAVAAGAHGVFIETHPDPKRAISDAACQIQLAEFGNLIDNLIQLWKFCRR